MKRIDKILDCVAVGAIVLASTVTVSAFGLTFWLATQKVMTVFGFR